MYPDWPQKPSQLAPLPNCEGPKLRPFDYRGPQKVKFLDHLGEGLHAHVFKVEIKKRMYALKLVSIQQSVRERDSHQITYPQFRFVYDDDWLGPADYTPSHDLEAMSAFSNYSEPFNAECRAFGRLRESGHEELAVQCFGYILLNEEHEHIMMSQFSHLNLDFNGNGDYPGLADMRSRFLGRDGKPPPLRGIVKALGEGDNPLVARLARRLRRNIAQLQQLGIIHIDVAHRQLIDGRFVDFSTAITTPHFVTNPELNPRLTPVWISAMEFETFQFSINDYWEFDNMVEEWNEENENRKDQISVFTFPGGHGCKIHYTLRPKRSRQLVYTFVDPRIYDWGAADVALGTRAVIPVMGRRSQPKVHAGTRKGVKGVKSWTSTMQVSGSRKTKRTTATASRSLDAHPPRWYYDCDSKRTAELKSSIMMSTSLSWEFRDGLIFPRKKR